MEPGDVREKISAATCSDKEIAGLKKMMTQIVKYGYERGELRVRIKTLGMCIARYRPVDYC